MSVRYLTSALTAAAVASFFFLILSGIYSINRLSDYSEKTGALHRAGERVNLALILVSDGKAAKDLSSVLNETERLLSGLLENSPAGDEELRNSFAEDLRDLKNAGAVMDGFASGKAAEQELIFAFARLKGSLEDTQGLLNKKSSEAVSDYRAAFIASSVTAAFLFGLILASVYLNIISPLGKVMEAAGRLGESAGVRLNNLRGNELAALKEHIERLSEGIKESAAHHRDLVSIIPDSVFELDAEGRLLYLNGAAKDLTGLTVEAKGNLFSDLLGEGRALDFREAFNAILGGGGLPKFELPINVNGRTARLELKGVPVRRDGIITGVCLVGRDMDEHKKIMEDLENARKLAEEKSAVLKETMRDLEDYALLSVRREQKMREIRERFRTLSGQGAEKKDFI